MRFLGKYFKKFQKPFFLAIACLLVEVFCDLMQPTIMSKIVDNGIASGDISYVLTMGGLMLAVAAVGAGGAIGRNILSSRVSMRFATELRSDLFSKVLSYSFNNIDRFGTASLTTRLTNDVLQMQNFVFGLMRFFTRGPLIGIGAFVMAMILNMRLSLALLAILPVIAAITILNIRFGIPLFKKVQAALDKVNTVMREFLSGVRVVKAFNRSVYEKQRFAAVNKELTSKSITAMRVTAAFAPCIALVTNLSILAVIWFGGISVNTGDMQVGQIIAFINYVTQILFAFSMISFIFTMYVRAKASAERINEVLQEQPGIVPPEQPADLPSETDIAGSAAVEFDHVCFCYPGASGEPVLRDFTFKCAFGETIGIIGSTGSGKTTLANLIPRFYDATSGSVKVSGINVKDTDESALRRIISYVSQKTVLFTGTIAENIRWGSEDAVDEEIQKAASVANAADFINSFPEGYGTLLGQGGVNLSGGQKQRISIARALVRRPRILILDDCTSSVDALTEAGIHKALKTYSRNLVCLVIAQRISSIIDADRIIVLENGAMAGMGTHSELMRRCAVYREIFDSQYGKDDMPLAAET